MGLPPYRPNAIQVGLLPLWHKLRVCGDLKRRAGTYSFVSMRLGCPRPPNTANAERTVGLGSVRASQTCTTSRTTPLPQLPNLSLSFLRVCYGNAGEHGVASRSWAKCLLENHHLHGLKAWREGRIDPFGPFFDL